MTLTPGPLLPIHRPGVGAADQYINHHSDPIQYHKDTPKNISPWGVFAMAVLTFHSASSSEELSYVPKRDSLDWTYSILRHYVLWKQSPA
jgi:hypothetical protein